MTVPPLLQKMMEVPVGDLVVRRDCIIEPKTGCRVASGFPNRASAIAAATEMNEVTDWFGVIKSRAEGHRPNCQSELERIANLHGGSLYLRQVPGTEKLCAAVVAQMERHS